MRIAHVVVGRVNPCSANGVEQMIAQQSSVLANLGHEVSILQVTSKNPIPISRVRVLSIEDDRRCVLSIPSAIRQYLAAQRPELVHLHSTFSPLNATVSHRCFTLGIPYVVSPHGALSPIRISRRAIEKRMFISLSDERMLARAACVHALTAQEQEDIAAVCRDARITVVPNAVPTPSDWHARDVVDSCIPELRGREYILFLGRLDVEQKGLDILLEAFSSSEVLAQRRLVLLLAGPDFRGGHQYVADYGRSSGDSSRLFLIGSVIDPLRTALLQHAIVVAHPSRSEGMSLVALEALASGAVSVMTDAASPVGPGVADLPGYVVRCTVSDFRSALEAAVTLDAQSRMAMQYQARAFAMERYSWDRIGSDWQRLYTSAACGVHR